MKLVIDSNILFSCLISGKKFYIQLLTQNQCYSPDFLLEELKKYEDRILKKGKIKINFKEFVREIFSNLIIIPKLAIDSESWKQAYEFCHNIDEKDIAYVALSIDLDLPLLTRDKKLFNGLKKKNFQDVILLESYFKSMNEAE